MKLISIFLFTSIFVLLFIEFFHPLTAITQDLGRHIKTGEIIVQTHHVPKINLFSYTYPNFPFINTHWLSEVIFYVIFQLTGFHGLLVFTTLITLVAFGIVFISVKRQALSVKLEHYSHFPYALTITSLLYFSVLLERTDVRPEIFSFLFVSIFISILYKYREKYTHFIFILPILELLWVNIHIYFVIGEILIGLFLADKLFTLVKNKNQEAKKTLIRDSCFLIPVFFLTFLTTFLNPNGIQGALYPFTVFNNYGYTIQENQNIFFLLQFGSSITITFFIITAFLLFFLLLINIKKSRVIDWLLALVFTYLAASAIRNFVLFVFVTFVPFVYSLISILHSLDLRRSIADDRRYFSIRGNLLSIRGNLLKISLFFLLMLVIIWEGYAFINKHGFGWSVPSGAQPAADFFLQNHLKEPIFNNFDIGSYLDYRFYPQEKVFVDGRPEAYPASFFQQAYIPMQHDTQIFLQQGIKDALRLPSYQERKYQFNTIFFAHTDQTPWATHFIHQIMNNTDWKPVYLDSSVVILLKNNEQNKTLIKKFAMDRDSLQIQNMDLHNLTQLLYLANFFITAGWTNQEVKMDQAILNLDQNNCIALSRLTTIYAQENNQLANVYEGKYRQNCTP